MAFAGMESRLPGLRGGEWRRQCCRRGTGAACRFVVFATPDIPNQAIRGSVLSEGALIPRDQAASAGSNPEPARTVRQQGINGVVRDSRCVRCVEYCESDSI